MARMLQALKNLEARAQWPAAGAGLLSHLSQAEKQPAQPREPVAEPEPKAGNNFLAQLAQAAPPAQMSDPAPVSPPPAEQQPRSPVPVLFTMPSAIVVQSPARFEAASSDAVVVSTFLPRESPPPAPTPPVPLPRPTTRPLTGAERAVRRTLGEPHRRKPLADLAARLRQDASKTGSRTLLLVGIGPDSATHETALHVATLLAEEGGNVLLVDGDLARRQLSADLDDLQEPGLSNLSREPSDANTLLRPTALQGLAFLPAGTERFANLEESVGDLPRSLGQLAARFDLVLVDGGRSGDPGTAALARLCDATYVVVQLGSVQASQAQQSLRELRAGGARVLGCIATGGDV